MDASLVCARTREFQLGMCHLPVTRGVLRSEEKRLLMYIFWTGLDAIKIGVVETTCNPMQYRNAVKLLECCAFSKTQSSYHRTVIIRRISKTKFAFAFANIREVQNSSLVHTKYQI